MCAYHVPSAVLYICWGYGSEWNEAASIHVEFIA